MAIILLAWGEGAFKGDFFSLAILCRVALLHDRGRTIFVFECANGKRVVPQNLGKSHCAPRCSSLGAASVLSITTFTDNVRKYSGGPPLLNHSRRSAGRCIGKFAKERKELLNPQGHEGQTTNSGFYTGITEETEENTGE